MTQLEHRGKVQEKAKTETRVTGGPDSETSSVNSNVDIGFLIQVPTYVRISGCCTALAFLPFLLS